MSQGFATVIVISCVTLRVKFPSRGMKVLWSIVIHMFQGNCPSEPAANGVEWSPSFKRVRLPREGKA